MRKSSIRNSHFRPGTSRNGGNTSTFRDQMADHVARGGVFKELRTNRHLSQERAAGEIGVSSRTVRIWEQNGGIKWENAEAAATYYGVDPDSLAVRKDKVEEEVDQAINGAPEEDTEPLSAADSERLKRVEEKLDEILKRLTPPDEGEDPGQKDDATPDPSPLGPQPNLPKQDEPPTDPEDEKRSA